jgi:hypothetical protein
MNRWGRIGSSGKRPLGSGPSTGKARRMEAQTYLINGRLVAAHDPALQEVLARVYGTPVRPRCTCVRGGIEMYVSKFHEFVIKRMPETGGDHRPTCPSYELPASESGLSEVLGEAIIERGPEGVELRLDFPLTRRIGHSFATKEPQPTGEVTVARKALSLRGLLHYLWERAGFNRWYPRMQGKRSYWVLRKFLLQASEEVETKGLRLAERVFIPENFSRNQMGEIARRREAALSILLSPDADVHFKLMIAIGELKAFAATTLGYTLVLKHLLQGARGNRTGSHQHDRGGTYGSGACVRFETACGRGSRTTSSQIAGAKSGRGMLAGDEGRGVAASGTGLHEST